MRSMRHRLAGARDADRASVIHEREVTMSRDGAASELAIPKQATPYWACRSQSLRRRPLPVLATHDNGLTTTDY
jgi:hypothetical protein